MEDSAKEILERGFSEEIFVRAAQRNEVSAGHGVSGFLSRSELGAFWDEHGHDRSRKAWLEDPRGSGRTCGFSRSRSIESSAVAGTSAPFPPDRKRRSGGSKRAIDEEQEPGVSETRPKEGNLRKEGRSRWEEMWEIDQPWRTHDREHDKRCAREMQAPKQRDYQGYKCNGWEQESKSSDLHGLVNVTNQSRRRACKVGSRQQKRKQTNALVNERDKSLCATAGGIMQIPEVPLDLQSGSVVCLVVDQQFHHGRRIHTENSSVTHGTVRR